MRLNIDEIESIKSIANSCFGTDSKVILFGSRVNDSLKGGDIDLYIIPGKTLKREELRDKKISYLVSLKSKIGDQKIDLVISRDRERLIEIEALKTGVEL